MAKNAKDPKRRPGTDSSGGEHDTNSNQLSLSFDATSPPQLPQHPAREPVEQVDRLEGLDQMMKTAEVVRLLRRHRTTIFRWIKKGLFPSRHASGDFLRSDIVKYLSDKSGGNIGEPHKT
jgi:predicted DNA-binding transcriptional regulator AlpA